jgi:hypothetical protein
LSKVHRDAAKVAGTVSSSRRVAGVQLLPLEGTGDQHAKDVRDKAIDFQARIYSSAAAYDNGVVIAGYVAFFALWAGSNKDVSHLCRLVTVALMGTSLICYMAWHILQMFTRQKSEFKLAEVFNHADDPERFNRDWLKVTQDRDIALMRTLRFWPFLFVPAVAFGLLAGVVLTYSVLAPIVGWPAL